MHAAWVAPIFPKRRIKEAELLPFHAKHHDYTNCVDEKAISDIDLSKSWDDVSLAGATESRLKQRGGRFLRCAYCLMITTACL